MPDFSSNLILPGAAQLELLLLLLDVSRHQTGRQTAAEAVVVVVVARKSLGDRQ
jgi:hypothetical protein